MVSHNEQKHRFLPGHYAVQQVGLLLQQLSGFQLHRLPLYLKAEVAP